MQTLTEPSDRGVPCALDGVHVSGFPTTISVDSGIIKDWPAMGINASGATSPAFTDLRINADGSDGIRVFQLTPVSDVRTDGR